MIYVANSLQLPFDPANPNPDKPLWDTMYCLRNILPDRDVVCQIQIRRDDGSLLNWFRPDGTVQDHCNVTVKAGLCWAASFIPGNSFNLPHADCLPPQNWQGAATIDCQMPMPFGGPQDATSKILLFALAAFNDWRNGFDIPVRKRYGPRGLSERTLWQFAYAIPHFDDSAGDTHSIWTTGAAIKNHGPVPGTGRLVYTIAQTYVQAGQTFIVPFSIGPYEKKTFDLLLGNPNEGIQGLRDVGYPAQLNSEGHVDIITDQMLLLQPSLLIADQQYIFTVSEDFQE